MRLFTTLREAASEIQRDLIKSPVVSSERVQNMSKFVNAHEATNYSYTLLPGAVPVSPERALREVSDVLTDFNDHDFRWKVAGWMDVQNSVRLSPFGVGVKHRELWNSDEQHPYLSGLKEGAAYSYTYPERTLGMVETMAQQLLMAPTSRRAFWPIFAPGDALRAADMTRIPCTIGYHAMIRSVPELGPQLHLTSLMRSMDFNHFWVSDIWFAARLQQAILAYLTPTVQLGQLSQTVLSFHIFNEEGLEIY